VQRIWHFLAVPHPNGANNTSSTATYSVGSSPSAAASSAVQKRTSDDLSTVLDNFTEIYSFLSNPGCECIQQQLRSAKGSGSRSLCQVLVNVPEKRCDAMKAPDAALISDVTKTALRKKYKRCKMPEIHGNIVLC
jgi:hypothetical protein